MIAFVWRTLLVWCAHGINPYILPTDDTAPGYVGRAIRALMLSVLAQVLLSTFLPQIASMIGTISA